MFDFYVDMIKHKEYHNCCKTQIKKPLPRGGNLICGRHFLRKIQDKE